MTVSGWYRFTKRSNEYEDYGLGGLMPCTLVEGYHHFKETCCLQLQVNQKVEAGSCSDRSVTIFQSTHCTVLILIAVRV
jgi:hypothetical protein